MSDKEMKTIDQKKEFALDLLIEQATDLRELFRKELKKDTVKIADICDISRMLEGVCIQIMGFKKE